MDFPGESKMVQEHMYTCTSPYEERQNILNKSKFPGELSQNSARTHTIFQEDKIS